MLNSQLMLADRINIMNTAPTILTAAARRLSTLALILAAGVAVGQNTTDDRLLACNGIENEQERLACFENVVRGLRAEPATAAPAAEARRAPPPESGPQSMPAPEDKPAPAATAAPDATPTPPARPTPAAPAPARAAPAAADRAEPAETDAAGKSGDLTGSSVVMQVWPQVDGRFTVRLENGQVWRETEGTRVGMPDVGASVEITRSLFGSYRMKIDGIPRLAWVRQLEE